MKECGIDDIECEEENEIEVNDEIEQDEERERYLDN